MQFVLHLTRPEYTLRSPRHCLQLTVNSNFHNQYVMSHERETTSKSYSIHYLYLLTTILSQAFTVSVSRLVLNASELGNCY